MVSVYSDADYLAAYKQKQRVFYVFLGVTIAYFALCICFLLYFISLPYADSMQTLPKALVYVVSALYVIFMFPFMAIKYSRVKRYYIMLSYVSEGLKTEEKNHFYSFRSKMLQKDNIDVIGCVCETEEGETLGVVKDISNFSSDIYTIEKAGKQILFPAVKGVIKSVNIAEKKVIVDKKIFEEIAVL